MPIYKLHVLYRLHELSPGVRRRLERSGDAASPDTWYDADGTIRHRAPCGSLPEGYSTAPAWLTIPGGNHSVLTCAPWSLDLFSRTLYYAPRDNGIPLQDRGFHVMHCLMSRPLCQAVPVETIEREVWRDTGLTRGSNIVAVYIAYLRRMMREAWGGDGIRTLKGQSAYALLPQCFVEDDSKDVFEIKPATGASHD